MGRLDPYMHLIRKQLSPSIGKDIAKNIQEDRHIQYEISKSRHPIYITLHANEDNLSNREDHFLHTHDYFELIYLYKGSGNQIFETFQKPMKEGYICLLNMNVRHAIILEDPEASILFNIWIRRESFSSQYLHILRDNDLFSSFFLTSLFSGNGKGEFIEYNGPPANILSGHIENLLLEFLEKKPGYVAAMSSHLILLFTSMLREHISRISSDGNAGKEIESALTYMNSNLKDMTLKKCAEKFHYSPSHLSSLFKETFNRNFSEILMDLKIVEAKLQLIDTQKSIDDITQDLGFYDRSHFNKSFKKHTGISPGLYRETDAQMKNS